VPHFSLLGPIKREEGKAINCTRFNQLQEKFGGAGRNRTPYGIENKGFPLGSTVASDQILNFRWGLAQISTIPDFVVRPHSPGTTPRTSSFSSWFGHSTTTNSLGPPIAC
jgi:hypothetical protein